MPANTFVWYELMTSDMGAAEAFYSNVVGWTPKPFRSEGPAYTLMHAGDRSTAGIMTVPDEAKQAGARPRWLGYIGVADVDAASERLKGGGGTVHRAPADIPEVGRFSVVADPQGAMFMLFQPFRTDSTPPQPGAPGAIGWHELYAADGQRAFDFYSSQFGWAKGDAMDMGPMGTYQLFVAGGVPIGGMMNKPEGVPFPTWSFYFNVPAIDGAIERVKAAGGQVLLGPIEVPGGMWIIQGLDPQGASFALLAPVR